MLCLSNALWLRPEFLPLASFGTHRGCQGPRFPSRSLLLLTPEGGVLFDLTGLWRGPGCPQASSAPSWSPRDPRHTVLHLTSLTPLLMRAAAPLALEALVPGAHPHPSAGDVEVIQFLLTASGSSSPPCQPQGRCPEPQRLASPTDPRAGSRRTRGDTCSSCPRRLCGFCPHCPGPGWKDLPPNRPFLSSLGGGYSRRTRLCVCRVQPGNRNEWS